MSAASALPPLSQTSLLDPRSTLLEYLEGDEKSFFWAVSTRGFRMYELPSRGKLDPAIRAFYNALTARNDRPSNETSAARTARLAASDANAAQAAHHLARPSLESRTDKTRRAKSHRRRRRTPPLSTLRGARARGRVHQRTLRFLLVYNPQSAFEVRPKRPVLVIADPVFNADGPRLRLAPAAAEPTANTAQLRSVSLNPVSRNQEYPRLRMSREEAQLIARLASDRRVTRALDFDAATPLFSRPDIGDFQTIHISAHALLNSNSPDRSGVVLSQFDRTGKPRNGFLPVAFISRLQLHAGLVTLSACQTALGKNAAGEGLIGISRAFLTAGAKRVVASVWSVEDGPTAHFMDYFYQGIYGRRLSPPDALFAAQKGHAPGQSLGFPVFLGRLYLAGRLAKNG